ncbi:unnamed protein product, partial [Anisakis simplex]|uniref:Uncharacterized protein n=1 Tax=Anisakis simplex TaxID=6269 RepID=A0A0M3KCV7_ANISI
MEVSEDADIEQLLALRNALMNQLNHTQATSSTSKQHGRSRRSSINKSCPAVQPSALSPTTFPPPPPSHHPKKRSKKRKISAQSKDDTASSSEIKSNSDNSRPASNNINRQSPDQQTKPIENQCSKPNNADEISIDAEHIVNKQSEQSKTFPESKHNQAHDQPPASAQCPFLHSNSIPISFVKNDTINATLNEDNCDNTVNDTDMTKTGFTNDRKRVHCDDDDDNDDGNAIKNGKIRETESLLVDTSGGASTECVNAGTKELSEQPISSPKEHGNEKTPTNEE